MHDLSPAIALRRELHDAPELSGCEQRTFARIRRFLETHTTLDVCPMDGWLYAAHREGDGLPGVLLRADVDAISGADGPYHGCGHDGHAAMLAATALLLEGRKVGQNVFLLFQPAEETGQGAQKCLALLDRERIDEVYGLHNLPGFALGEVLVRPGTFACASKGLILLFMGSQAHAAYPETGRNPAKAIAQLVDELDALAKPEQDELVMATLVHMRAGSRAFGVSAGEGELCLTLRAERQSALEAMAARIVTRARALCAAHGLSLATQEQDAFPDTRCDPQCVSAFASRAAAAGLKVRTLPAPMRWSEDFGCYLQQRRGVFFGLGIGEAHAALHTPGYAFDDALLPYGARAFLAALGAQDT